VTWLGVWCNIFLAAFKLFAGIVGRSSAMIADAGHSLSDLVSDGVTLWAVRVARLPADADHPYGHGRFEAVGAFVISVMLMSAGYSLGNHAYESFLRALPYSGIPTSLAGWKVGLLSMMGHMGAASASVTGSAAPPAAAAAAAAVEGFAGMPGKIALVAALVSIVSKELLYRVTARVGKKLNSQVLIANAWHHRSDALSSFVAVGGIVGATMGLPVLDPLAGLMVSAMLTLTGLQCGWDSVKALTDTADTAMVSKLGALLDQVEGVQGHSQLRARSMGSDTLVDVKIHTHPRISASAAHQVAERARWHLLRNVPMVSDVLVTLDTSGDKICPVTATLRPHSEIEKDVRRTVAPIPGVQVTRMMAHYNDMMAEVDVFVTVDPNIRVSEASRIGKKVCAAIEGITDIRKADIHLDLDCACNMVSVEEMSRKKSDEAF